MSHSLNVAIKQLAHAKDLALPHYASTQAAGMDLRAAVTEPQTLGSGQRLLIPTGLCIALPEGYEAQIRPRSGLALRHGLTVLNSPGTIDADYRGELQVLLINHGEQDFVIQRGERIAQMIIAAFTQVSWQLSDNLADSARGEQGFGSSGTQ